MLPDQYHLSTTETKLAFLEKIMENKTGLQEEFLAFLGENNNASDKSVEDPQGFIAEIAQELRDELEGLNLSDPDWECYVPRHSGYIPEYEAIDDMNQQQVEELMEGYYDAMEQHCMDKEFDKAFLVAVGCYDACQAAEIEDEYSSLGDSNDFLLQTLQEALTKLNNLFSMVNIPEGQFLTLFEAVCIHSNNLYAADGNFLKYFEPSLINLLTGNAKAAIADAELKKQNIPQAALPQLAARIEEMLRGDKAWEETALKFFTEDEHLAHDLLHLYAENDYTAFVKIAFELWQKEKFKSSFAPLYFGTLQPGKDTLFYKEVCWYLLHSKYDVKYYEAARNFMSFQERNELLEKIVRQKVLFVQVLNVENRFEEALDFIEAEADEYNLEELIQPFIRNHPSRSFHIISKTIHKTLEKGRGRNVYERIARILKLTSTISKMGTETRQLIHAVHDRRPALPALREELRSAGLWPC